MSQDSAEFPCKVSGKLGAKIGDDLVEQAESGVEFFENEGGNSLCSDHLLCRVVNYPL